MGKCIEITRYKQANDIIYYFVSTDDFGGAEFYIGINTLNKQISFYDTSNFQEKVLIVYDIDTPMSLLESIPLNKKVLPYVILQIKKAFKKNYFPAQIGYAA